MGIQINLDDVDQFTKHFVEPMVQAVRTELQNSMTPLIQDVKDLKAGAATSDGRLDKLEKDQKHALIGYGVFSAGLAAGLAAAWGWIKSHLKIS